MDYYYYPKIIGGKTQRTAADHLWFLAEKSEAPYVAVPVDILKRVLRYHQCASVESFDYDEDGPMPMGVFRCSRELGHAHPDQARHIREHSNGYYTWEPWD